MNDSPRHTPPPARALTRKLRTPLFFVAAYAALLLLHWTLLDLPYYWDEAGYFIPAARDIYADGSFIPHSTLSNAHPPLVMAYIAAAWKLLGFHVWAARAAMAGVAAVALTGVYALGRRVANESVGLATAICTALYPVFFAQSTLAHLDMMVAALTVWALVFYLPRRDTTQLNDHTTALDDRTTQSDDFTTQSDEATTQSDEVTTQSDEVTTQSDDSTTQSDDDATALSRSTTELGGDAQSPRASENAYFRRALCVFLLALAALAKETAVLVPVVLCGWELVCWFLRKKEKLATLVCVERRPAWWSLTLLLAGVPLALWFAYHRARTGYTLGNPEYFRYNVESTLNLARILDTVWRRLGHVTLHMNLWALTLAGLAAMFLKPRRDGERERPRISVPVQLLFLVLILAHVVALSVVGGAVLARYMLPVLPLVVMVWVSTLWRRVPAWPLAVALVCAAFAYRTEVNPSYSFPWEENLAYRDFIILHRDAARFLAEKYPDARVLTSWPATDELRNPYYGYTPRALSVVPVENFLPAELQRAAARKSDYDVAFLYSSHGGPGLDEAARLLGARVVFQKERQGQWVAVVDVSGKQ
ncbi:MAG TPA: glycosyltransferase family 39 protein [Pyrinomonadaceae bacterium]